MYFIFVVFRYSYKITFNISEMYFIDINELSSGYIIDKDYLIKLFGTQESLGYCKSNIDKEIKETKKDLLLYPSPKEYFLNIENPISEETSDKIKEAYKIVNNYQKEKDGNYIDNNNIKVLKTFSFAHYILIGFLITYIFENKFFVLITNLIIKKIKGDI
ncbi:MAG: hypothetical protein PHH98_03695 [Candidatus Gracilibacteria bacterium]|nr:hypothetical protein [Candidatus Gracilibacteria bacterium]